jgi:putative membrane protein insertion efficiency factor
MKFAALALIRFYRICLSPLLPSFCRYYPTCSVYAYEAIERYGAWRGTGMALRRVLRCRPGGGYGYDPVPEEQVSGVGCQVSGGA